MPVWLQIRTSLGLQAFTSQLAPASLAAGELLPPLAITHFLAGEAVDFVSLQFSTAGAWMLPRGGMGVGLARLAAEPQADTHCRIVRCTTCTSVGDVRTFVYLCVWS
jgi:hypothetical protein